jgi:hypothetical protein
MSTLVATFEGLPGLIAPARSTAQSDPAKDIEKILEKVREHLLQSYALSTPAEHLITELIEVFAETSREGWDGYGARPLNPLSFEFAIRFLNALPATVPFPELGADIDGEVVLDWIFGARKALTISIDATGRCTYAWMLGQSTSRGTVWMDNEIPAQIVFALGQLARATTARHGL